MSDRNRANEFPIDCTGCDLLRVNQRTDFVGPNVEYYCGNRWIGFLPHSRREDCPVSTNEKGVDAMAKKPEAKKEAAARNKAPAKKAKKPVPKKPRVKKPSKMDKLIEAESILTDIERAEKDCEDLRNQMDNCKEEYKAAKEAYNHQVNTLRKLCRARDERHPLFDNPVPVASETATPPVAATTPAAPAESKPAPDDAWRAHSLAAAGLTDKQIDALEGADIRTLGDLQDAMTRHGLFWAKNLKVNGRLQQDIEDTFNEYLTKYATPSA